MRDPNNPNKSNDFHKSDNLLNPINNNYFINDNSNNNYYKLDPNLKFELPKILDKSFLDKSKEFDFYNSIKKHILNESNHYEDWNNLFKKSFKLTDFFGEFILNSNIEIEKFLYVFNKDIFGLFGFNYIHYSIIIDLLIVVSIISAIYTILSKNPIISVLFLIGLYISVAIYIVLIGLQFIGLSYILIYVGAISILFIFILMLINIRISELLSNTVNSFPLIIILLSILNSILYTIIPNKNTFNYTFNNKFNYIYESDVFNINNIKWDNGIIEFNTISSLGNTLYSDNFVIFLETSLILLLAMIGAIIITIKSDYNNKIKIKIN